jgi:prepilin-type N-terminal cleavage/methylation domain-containing protein
MNRQCHKIKPFRVSRFTHAFTLIELILVMALLTIAVSVTAPALSKFFRGRTLDSEARRLLAVTRMGQNRAVAEGVPMDLWIDKDQGKFGLEMEPSYEKNDPKGVDYDLDPSLQIEAIVQQSPAVLGASTRLQNPSVASVPKVALVKPGLPTIRFLPDGFVSPTSPQTLRLVDRDGFSLLLTENKARNGYDITTAQN